MKKSLPVVLICALLLLWEACVRMLHIPLYVLPAPTQVIAALTGDIPTLARHAWVSLSEALKIAFLEMRRDRVIAHIYHENSRFRHLFVSRGFVPCTQGTYSTKYQLTFDAYLHPEVSEKDEIA